MSWRAGIGIADITPPVPLALAGFGARTEPAHAVHDPLDVRAVYLEAGGRGVCLLVCDLLGLSDDIARDVRAAVAGTLGITSDAVLPSCIHTHSGPNTITGGDMLGWASVPGYTDLLTQRCVEAARAARDNAVPADLRFARAPLPDGVSINRRGLDYEPWFCALDIIGADGERIGVLANVSIHPVVLSHTWAEVSSDWVGIFRQSCEKRSGGTVVLMSGALGDVNPSERHTDEADHIREAWDEASFVGETIAAAVSDILATATHIEAAIEVSSRILTVPTGSTPLTALVQPGPDVTVELVEWKLGACSLVGIPGEAFHALGRAIDDARGGRALLAGLAPSWNGYLPMPYTDGYEETISFGPDAVTAIADALIGGPSTC